MAKGRFDSAPKSEPSLEEVRDVRTFERFIRYEFRLRPDRDDDCPCSAFQRDLLREIGRGQGGPSVGQLVTRFHVDKGQLSRNLAWLEAAGFLESRPAHYDARVRIVEVTGLGRFCSRGYENTFAALWRRAAGLKAPAT